MFLLDKNLTIFDNFKILSQTVGCIYERVIEDYHILDSIEQPMRNPYPDEKIEHLFYLKCWIDTVQWHLEDEVRNPDMNSNELLKIKRSIDFLNGQRTDKVELIDSFFVERFKEILPLPDARINSESPAWALDRLSINSLKIYHMKLETLRKDANDSHVQRCKYKLEILREQQKDLFLSINELLQEISEGKKYMKVYKQMKMYNDPTLNPVLYKDVRKDIL